MASKKQKLTSVSRTEAVSEVVPTEAELVELTSSIAWENYRARFNRPFLIGPSGFSAGAFCPLPERP